jgi:hypothetical protein
MFDYASIRHDRDPYPIHRVRDSEDETGRVAQLDAAHGCVGNGPINPDLFMHDIVMLRLTLSSPYPGEI